MCSAANVFEIVPADNGIWMRSAEDWPTATARLFVRGDSSVRMEARRQGEGFLLEISGPRNQRRTLHATDVTVLMQQQAELEARLIRDGYTLQSSTDRRRFFRR